MKPCNTMGLPNFWDTRSVQNVGYKMESSSARIVIAAECSNARHASCQFTKTFPYIALCSNHLTGKSQLMKPFVSIGMEIFSRRTASATWDFAINLAIQVRRAHVLSLVPPTSLSSISPDFIQSPSIIVIAKKSPYQPGGSCCVKGGFQQLSQDLKLILTFECLKTFHELMLQGKTNLYDFYHMLV